MSGKPRAKTPIEDADRGEQQDRTEYRIDAADDLVDREYGRDQIIYEDHAVDPPMWKPSPQLRQTRIPWVAAISPGV